MQQLQLVCISARWCSHGSTHWSGLLACAKLFPEEGLIVKIPFHLTRVLENNLYFR